MVFRKTRVFNNRKIFVEIRENFSISVPFRNLFFRFFVTMVTFVHHHHRALLCRRKFRVFRFWSFQFWRCHFSTDDWCFGHLRYRRPCVGNRPKTFFNVVYLFLLFWSFKYSFGFFSTLLSANALTYHKMLSKYVLPNAGFELWKS